MDMMTRRRTMMGAEEIELPGEKLFIGASWVLSTEMTRNGDTVIATTTSAASWNLTYHRYGNAAYFKKFSEVAGHTIKIKYHIKWDSHAAGGLISLAVGIFDSITSNTPTRRRYTDDSNALINEQHPASLTRGEISEGSGIVYLKLPDTLSGFPKGSGGSASSYLAYRLYVYSNAGSKVESTFKFYDCGIV